jgi:hypothetical protein
VCAVALHGHALADDQASAVETATNNLSHQFSICAAYYKVTGACFYRGKHAGAVELAIQAARQSLGFAEMLGHKAGISKIEAVLIARDNMAVKALRKEIDDNCSNISILLDKYGDMCKAINDDPGAALAGYIAQAQQRMPK